MSLEICLKKNFDGLVTGVDFDADRGIAEIDFVSATIFPRMIAWGIPCGLAVCCSRHDRRAEVEHHCSAV
jgi:hypothetical protein